VADLLGKDIGRYKIVEQLGQGGMATVYKAFDTRLERDVAIKVIRREAFSQEVLDSVLKRFEREAKTLAKLTHPNIVPVIDYGEFEGSPYLVMPFLPGGTLKGKMGTPMSYRAAARLLAPVADALAYAHQEGIVHRDVKPANILITSGGQPMLSDFGITKLLEGENNQSLTGTGVGIGTPEYMAPEQSLGNEVDGRADEYSLGIVFYELITGHKPFQADTPMAVLLKQVNDPLPAPRQFVPDLPEKVEQVLYKSLAKNPLDRYQTTGQVASALEALMSPSAETGEALQAAPPQILDAKDEYQTGTATVDVLEAAKKRDSAVPAAPGIPEPKWMQPPALPIMEIGKTVTIAPPQLVPGTLPGAPPARPFPWVWVGVIGIVGLLVMLVIGLSFYLSGNTGGDLLPTRVSDLAPTNAPGVPALVPAPSQPVSPTTASAGQTSQGTAGAMTEVTVPGGGFSMGSNDGDANERPIHTVILDAFSIDQTEVTNSMFAQFVQQTGYVTDAEKIGNSLVNRSEVAGADWRHPDGPGSDINGKDSYPVVNVSWNDAFTYCQWAGKRLPTEAEWEKAAAGTHENTYPWGNTIPDSSRANINTGAPVPVGSYPAGASPYGALDMAGNVWEWVNDWYGVNYYQSSPINNPTGATSAANRGQRGGSFAYDSYNGRSANRSGGPQDSSSYDVGFRCAR
jgi:eukaryotic-like serine/threonine-protein kinase